MTRPAAARLPRPRHLNPAPTPIRPERRFMYRLPIVHRIEEPTQLPLGLNVRLHLIEGGATAPEPLPVAQRARRAA